MVQPTSLIKLAAPYAIGTLAIAAAAGRYALMMTSRSDPAFFQALAIHTLALGAFCGVCGCVYIANKRASKLDKALYFNNNIKSDMIRCALVFTLSCLGTKLARGL